MTDESWYVVPARKALSGTAKPQEGEQEETAHEVPGKPGGSLLGQGADRQEGTPLYVRPPAGRRRRRSPRPPTTLQDGAGPQHAGAMKLASGGGPGAAGSTGVTPREEFHGLHPQSPKSRLGRIDFVGRPGTVAPDVPLLHLVPDSLRVLPPLRTDLADDEDEDPHGPDPAHWRVES